MAEINFLPVCSYCKNVLKDELDWTIDELFKCSTKYEAKNYYLKAHGTAPYKCPCCNGIFTAITVPTKTTFKEKKMTENKNEKVDNVNHPTHYADHCSLECFNVMKIVLGPAGTFEFCLGNAFKYLWRHKFKNGEEDVNKAGWYLTKADQLYSEYQDNELFMEEKNKLDQMMELYKMTKAGYME